MNTIIPDSDPDSSPSSLRSVNKQKLRTIGSRPYGVGETRDETSFESLILPPQYSSEVVEEVDLLGDLVSPFSIEELIHTTSLLSVESDVIPTPVDYCEQSLNSESSISPAINNPRKRRRIAEPEEWKKNKRKAARNHGLPYIKEGNIRKPAKELKPPCNCKMSCGRKFAQRDRQRIFNEYWALGDVNRQRELIGKLIITKNVERGRTNGRSRRKRTLEYRFKRGNKFVRVCKRFFLNTLDVSEKKVRVVIAKASRSNTGALSPDRRGRHVPANKLPEQEIENIKRHISLLPKVPAHWCRRDSTKTYIEGALNQESVYQLYVDWANENGMRVVCKPVYVEQLKSLNIAFHQPKKDQCWCAGFDKFSPADKIEKQEEYDLHIRRKEEARKEKIKDTQDAREDHEVFTATFDLEAILYCPSVATKQLFYKRKLATFNFTVYDAFKKQGYCYMWPEIFGKKGSQEVSTCLQKFISNEVSGHVKKLNFFADNCAGQNKNSLVVTMLGTALQAHRSLEEINLKFLETGHTYMECDTMHSVIERAARNQNIFNPSDWMHIAHHAKKTGKQYSVDAMKVDEFLNFKELKEKILPKPIRFTDGTKLKWRCVKWIQFRRGQRDSIFIKNEYWEPFKEVVLARPFKPRQLNSLYSSTLPISRAKYRDLNELCRAKVIPRRHRSFYYNLVVEDDDDDEGVRDGQFAIR